LEVGGVHNFLVGDGGMVVHNGCAKTLYSILNVMNLDHELILGKKWTHKARKTDKLDTPADKEEIRISEIIGEEYKSNVFLAPNSYEGLDAIIDTKDEVAKILSFKGMTGNTAQSNIDQLRNNVGGACSSYKKNIYPKLPNNLKDNVKCDVCVSGKYASGAQIQAQWALLLQGGITMSQYPMIGKVFYIDANDVIHELLY
jgi:hypothetical protein